MGKKIARVLEELVDALVEEIAERVAENLALVEECEDEESDE